MSPARCPPLRQILPGGKGAQAHLSLSDASGDSAIFEYLDGELTIHHNRTYRVMTNSPAYAQQLAIEGYWRTVGGTAFLPGTSRASDRFARASFLLEAIPKTPDPAIISAVPNRTFEFQALASVRSVMQAVSVPLGIKDPTQPNIASTYWRTIIDNGRKLMLFDSATSPNTFWVRLADLDLKQGAPIKQLPLAGQWHSGDAAAKFKPASPFKFLGGTPTP
jgi:penicillin V acylase-like amidase (Ntn superfamily)